MNGVLSDNAWFLCDNIVLLNDKGMLLWDKEWLLGNKKKESIVCSPPACLVNYWVLIFDLLHHVQRVY